MKAYESLLRTEEGLSRFEIIGFDERAARRFEEFSKGRLRRKAGRNDLLIASIALAHGATLVTRNVKHFRQFPGLLIENWAN